MIDLLNKGRISAGLETTEILLQDEIFSLFAFLPAITNFKFGYFIKRLGKTSFKNQFTPSLLGEYVIVPVNNKENSLSHISGLKYSMSTPFGISKKFSF